MRSLTEQVTFKVSAETLAQLQQRGRTQGLDANPYARRLVEEGLDRGGTENLADEFRELLAVLRPLADRMCSLPTESTPMPSNTIAAAQLEQFSNLVQRATESILSHKTEASPDNQPAQTAIALIANRLLELRADLNKTFAALLHYNMGFSAEEAQHWVDVRLSRGN